MRRLSIHLILLMAVVSAFAGCGGASQPQGHGTEAEAAVTAPAPPTPDTTPIEILRTPAGLALKLGAPPVTGIPSPGPTAVATPPSGS